MDEVSTDAFYRISIGDAGVCSDQAVSYLYSHSHSLRLTIHKWRPYLALAHLSFVPCSFSFYVEVDFNY